ASSPGCQGRLTSASYTWISNRSPALALNDQPKVAAVAAQKLLNFLEKIGDLERFCMMFRVQLKVIFN
ncbi:MAG TPA: hypothetical protein VKP30_00330, partial [Polyangiaceae bacterium]|nr:hypothetical protein [Polyangiaceae bacterium]